MNGCTHLFKDGIRNRFLSSLSSTCIQLVLCIGSVSVVVKWPQELKLYVILAQPASRIFFKYPFFSIVPVQISGLSSIRLTWINDWLSSSFIKWNIRIGHSATLGGGCAVNSIYAIWTETWKEEVPQRKVRMLTPVCEESMPGSSRVIHVHLSLCLSLEPWCIIYQFLIVCDFT